MGQNLFVELDERREAALKMGGEEAVARQHSQGKLTARERIHRLLDDDSFREMGQLAGHGSYDARGKYESFRPANAVIGTGRVEGRRIVVSADDYTLRGGSSEATVSDKWIYAERYAYKMTMPLVRLVETAGGSVRLLEQQQATKLPGYALSPLFPLLSQAPVVGVALGPCAGLGAIKVAASHFSVMVEGMSQLFAGGPPVVKRGIGEVIDKEALGGARVHTQQSGVVTNAAASEADAFEQVRKFLSYMPINIWHLTPRERVVREPSVKGGTLDVAISDDERKAYNINKILKGLFDEGSIFELAPKFGRSMKTVLARLDGYAVGVIANNPIHQGGALTLAAARKIERFIDICDTFHLPIVNLVDQPGVMIGSAAERSGTFAAVLKANGAMAQSAVPWCTIVMRRAYGVGGGMHTPHFRMDGSALRHRFAWPTARWGSIPIEGGVEAAYRREIAESDNPGERLLELEQYYKELTSPYRTAERFGVVDIIKPSETRGVLVTWVEDASVRVAQQRGFRLRGFR